MSHLVFLYVAIISLIDFMILNNNMVFIVCDKLIGIKIFIFLIQIYKVGKNVLYGSTEKRIIIVMCTVDLKLIIF